MYMKLIDRYILRCFSVPLLFCLLGFGLLFIIYDLFDHLNKFMEAETPALLIALYYLCLLLPTLEYIAPASLLLASLYTLWQFTRNNELTAMRASGVSLYRIMAPLLIVGIAFSLAASLIKETLATRAFEWTQNFEAQGYTDETPNETIVLTHYNVGTRRLWRIEEFNLNKPTVLYGVKVTQERPDATRVCDYYAEHAQWLDGAWWFFDVWIQRYDERDNPVGEKTPMTPGLESVSELRELSESPEVLRSEATPWYYLTTPEMIRYLKHHPNLDPKIRADKLFDIHQRLSLPWACFIVTLFGIPAGTRSARQGILIGIFLAMTFFFGFYALSQIGLFLGRRQIVEPWLGAWLSNGVFFITGCVMLLRMR